MKPFTILAALSIALALGSLPVVRESRPERIARLRAASERAVVYADSVCNDKEPK